MEKNIDTAAAIETLQSTSDWTHLSWFQLEYMGHSNDNPTAYVYRNGRQQVPVKIIIEARNSANEVVLIPNSELQNIRLVDYATQTAIQGTVVGTVRDERYDFFSEMGPAGASLNGELNEESALDSSIPTQEQIKAVLEKFAANKPDSDMTIQKQDFFLYLTTTSGQGLHIGAKLEAGSGGVFHTCSPDVPAGGGPKGGEFNSSLTISPQTPRHFPASAFSMHRDDYISIPQCDIDIYTAEFTDRNMFIRQVIHYSLTYQGGWHYADYVGNDKNYFLYAFTESQTEAAHWLYSSPNMKIRFPVNTYLVSDGKISLARVTELGTPVHHDIPTIGKVGYIDNFGNESTLFIRPIDYGNEFYFADI